MMLISTEYRFLMLRPTKVASSSVGSLISSLCDIRIGTPEFGKHDQLTEIVNRYSWIFDKIPLEKFKIFLLTRDPLERVVSLYTAHSAHAFQGQETSTAGMTADDFVRKWLPANTWMSLPQFLHGLLADRGFSVDYIITGKGLRDKLKRALATVGVDINTAYLPNENVSPPLVNRNEIRQELQVKVRELYKIDQFLLENYADRELNSDDKRLISSEIASCYGAFDRNSVEKSIVNRFLATTLDVPGLAKSEVQ
jgi:hypothetical protein